VREVVARLEGHGATAAPEEPQERSPEPPALVRRFEAEGEEWLARSAGTGLGGTGRVGLAGLDAVRFARASRPERPLREALVPVGRLAQLFEEELRELLRGAQQLPVGPDD